VVVIGAAGAPAPAAVAILSHRGFQVTASNGRLQGVDRSRKRMRERDRRTQRVRRTRKNPCKKGVARMLSIPSAQSRSPTLLATTRHGGAVAACGWAGGMICRSRSPESSRSCLRLPIGEVWGRLASGLDREKLAAMTSEIGLAEVIESARGIVEGRVRGRIVVKIG
jgi:acrylyl-CoA reductase (NADPH)